MIKFGLGYMYLNPEEKATYETLYSALKQHETSCDITRIKQNVDNLKVMSTIMGDNPEIIYVNKLLMRTVSGISVKQLIFTGCIPQSQIKSKEKQLEDAVNDAVWEIDKYAHHDREILQGILEYLERNVVYDYDEYASNMKSISSVKIPDSHNAYGALVNHKAVCDGFSSAYAIIAKSFGFQCMLAKGKSSFNGGGKVNHAWNIVEYENQFYHVDATWDANAYAVSKKYSYAYFGLSDEEIMLEHDWDYHYTPICNTNKLSYYWSNSLVAKSEFQIENIIIREFKKGKTDVRVKISGGLKIKDYKYWNDKLPQIMSRAKIFQAFHYMWNEYAGCLTIYLN